MTTRLGASPVAIVPRPLSVTAGSAGVGAVLADGLAIAYSPELAGEARWFRRVLETGTGWEVNLAGADEREAAQIELRLGDLTDLPSDLDGLVAAATRHEAYRLSSSSGRVLITASTGAGAFYGLQSLRQLLPDSVFRQAGRSGLIPLPDVEIVDAPRLVWRGVHLDVCRHFLPKSFVLELIDLVALHKCNVFHLHLTEDQGWRFPVERYPRLTEIGAWRSESPAGHGEDGRFDGTPHGGFYTREDLEEIVAFAAERHVNVLPEVDMPGHMAAAIAAYPELGNTEKPLHVRTKWGISRHVLNLEERTIRFCTDVIDEVVSIFPWPYVHVGGDECPTIEWETSSRASELMREHRFTEERQLQGWFTARMAGHLATRGRTLVGWSEILEAGAPEGSIVMAWRGEEDGVAAAA
ncbi:MAG TPA: beta-N-acetylhexosaminidase, partial [Acidimicrobiales bacterium]|nr:beta-N-acetylhexosaminidase [Acidimicrobiales bacterium]